MVSRRALNAALPCALIAGLTATADARAQLHIDELLSRVASRVAEFYSRAKNVVCIETSTVQNIDLSNSLVGFARTVEFELRIEAGEGPGPDEASIVRKVRKVNGRVPRPSDKKDRSGCTDPNPLASEPLSFLLPSHHAEYRFKSAGTGEDRDRPVLLIDFVSVERRSRPELIEDPGGHEDCFEWQGHIASRGRIWIDAASYDVLRVDRSLPGPVDVKVPELIQRRYRLDPAALIVRDDFSIRYKSFAFTGPDEELLLPESIDSLTVLRGGLQSTRRHHRYSGYQRFVTGGRVVSATLPAPQAPHDDSADHTTRGYDFADVVLTMSQPTMNMATPR